MRERATGGRMARCETPPPDDKTGAARCAIALCGSDEFDGSSLLRSARVSCARVFKGDRQVATQAGDLCPPHRTPAHAGSKLLVRAGGQLRCRDCVPLASRLPRWIGRYGGALVPRADFLADIAAIDMVADAAGIRFRDV